jgi:hypothetical protein
MNDLLSRGLSYMDELKKPIGIIGLALIIGGIYLVKSKNLIQ